MKKVCLILSVIGSLLFADVAKAQDGPAETIVLKLPGSDLTYEMILVEGGSFVMGDSTKSISRPLHNVTLSSFYIGRYEVTVEQYRAFCRVTGRKYPEIFETRGGKWIDNHPAVNMDWNDALAFCKWIGGLLPTEAQWEFAARGGNKSQGLRYAGSDEADEVSWHTGNVPTDEDAVKKTQPVGTKKPNELGIYDMSGNVWEWCSDWFSRSYYKNSIEKDPQGAEKGVRKVRRGGSWFFPASRSAVGLRGEYTPSTKLYGLGIRVMKPIN